jgi:polysaccharide biosynthesis protein PslG
MYWLSQLNQRRAWILRALILATTFTWANVPRPYVILGPKQTVQTRHPVTCVHTRLTDEVEAWKVLRSLEMVRGMGAPTIVEYFPWAYYEGEQDNFAWGHADMVMDFAENQGLTVVARLSGLVPEWARRQPDGTETVASYLDSEHFADFGDYVYAFITHFKGRVKYVILWNEPNVTAEWGFRPVDPEAYTELLKVAYTRAKEADPTILVLAGALAPTLEPEGSELAMNDLIYLERMYAAGAGDYFDILAAHAYGLKFPPDDPSAPDALNFRRVELLRQIMVEYGDADKPMMLTESGWNDSPRWTRAVSPGVRIDYTLGGYMWAEQHWPWMQAVCTWAFRYPAPQHSYGDYFTFVSPEFVPKPIYEAVREWATE